MTAHADMRPGIPPLPRLSLVLLGAAALDMVLLLWARFLLAGRFESSPPGLFTDLLDAMPFVLAASLAAGWNRWPAGRASLMAGAASYAVAGVLDGGSQVALAVMLKQEALPSSDAFAVLNTVTILGMLAAMGAGLLTAAGLWRGVNASSPSGWRARAAVVGAAVAVLVTVAAAVTAVRLVYEIISLDAARATFANAASAVIYQFSSVPLALLGAVAMRRLARRHLLPELLIGVGALGASLAWWLWTGSLFFALGPHPPAGGMLAMATTAALHVIATAILALGFFAARLSVPAQA